MLLDSGSPHLACSLLLLLSSSSLTDADNKQGINQSPASIRVPAGASVSITCVISPPLISTTGMNFKRRDRELVYINENQKVHIREGHEFTNRSHVSGTEMSLTITLHRLQKSDSDWYTCDGYIKNLNRTYVKGGGTMLNVTSPATGGRDEPSSPPNDAWKWEFTVIIALVFVIVALCIVIAVQNMECKKCSRSPQKKQVPNLVYEDMTMTIHRNTMTRQNLCNGGITTDNHPSANHTMGYTARLLQPNTEYSTSP